MKKKIIRAVTVDVSLGFIEGVIPKLKEKYDIQLLSSPGDIMNRIIKNYNLVGHEVKMYRKISILHDFKSLWKIINIFHSEKPDLVHSMTPKAGFLCMTAAWIMRVPNRVHTFTGLIWPTQTGILRVILMAIDWLTCLFATNIIAEGKGVMNDLQTFITKKPIEVLGYGNVKGIDLIRFSRRTEVMEMADKLRKKGFFTFLFVGRIVKDKGINELVKSFKRFHDIYPKTRLIIVGNNDNHSIEQLTRETLELIDSMSSIEIVGPQFDDNLVSYYAASDCFVFPSYREGFPNAVIEAGAMGLPSIVTDINGSREIIINDRNGIIIPSKNVDAIYEAMLRIYNDAQYRNSLAMNARPLVAYRYDKDYVQKCLCDYYEKILTV